MNHTIASCGHSVPAVGSPGSKARKKCEQEKCIQCSIESRLGLLEKLMAKADMKDLPALNAAYQKLLERLL